MDRISRGVSQADLVTALQDADPRDQISKDLNLVGNEEVELIYELPEGPMYNTFDPAAAVAWNDLTREPLPEGEVFFFGHGDMDAAAETRRARASGKKPTLRLQNPREERLRQARINRFRQEDRDRRAQEEIDWLNRNQLFKGRRPAPGEEFGAYAERIRGQTDRERQSDERRRKRIDMRGNYYQDLDLSGFTADQFVYDIDEDL